MDTFFCAEASRCAQEDLMGTASYHQTYVLIECKGPWAANALDTPHLPADLRQTMAQAMAQAVTEQRSIRFLLINRNQTKVTDEATLLIYTHVPDRFFSGYQQREFKLPSLAHAAPLIRQYLANPISTPLPNEVASHPSRDILICTHGSHDQCCARYGNPFYTQAIAQCQHLRLAATRIWRASHFGGHRFAPTAISLPDGRYYGRLDRAGLAALLTCTGQWDVFQKCYRGWGFLPVPLQVLEQTLIQRWGWPWLGYAVAYRILEQPASATGIKVELIARQPNGGQQLYRARIMADPEKQRSLKGSCHAVAPSEFVKYSVQSLMHYSAAFAPAQSRDRGSNHLSLLERAQSIDMVHHQNAAPQ
jgi:hypothetical protein